jgi:hypothetical protein
VNDTIEVIVTLSESKVSDYAKYVHLFDDCPAVGFGRRRDGDIHRQAVTQAELSDLLDHRAWCGNCARRTPWTSTA